MDEAFLALMAKKDFEYITVKEICEVAGVNRSTFYLHYETMSDLLSESVLSLIHILHAQVHYLPVYWHSYYEKLGYPKGLCPNAEYLYEHVMSIPLFYLSLIHI